MTAGEIVARAAEEGVTMGWLYQDGAVKITVARPAAMAAVPGWLIDAKANWDAEALRLAIMESASRKAVPMTAADVVRRCRKEGILLTIEMTVEGEPTVGYTMPSGQDLPAWLRAWALFNATDGRAALLNLTEDDI